MRAALKSGGLEERYCIKEGLAGTSLTTACKGVFHLLQRKIMPLIKADYLKDSADRVSLKLLYFKSSLNFFFKQIYLVL